MAQPHEERSTLQKGKEQLGAKARAVEEDVRSTAEEEVTRRKAEVSGKAHAIASALRDAGDSLEERGEDQLARWGRQTADQVERMARYLERNDFSGLLQDLENTARGNSAAFVGGTFAAGLLLGRFLRSSAPEPDDVRRATTGMAPGGTMPGALPTPPSMSGPSARPASSTRDRIRVPPAGEPRESFGASPEGSQEWKEITHE